MPETENGNPPLDEVVIDATPTPIIESATPAVEVASTESTTETSPAESADSIVKIADFEDVLNGADFGAAKPKVEAKPKEEAAPKVKETSIVDPKTTTAKVGRDVSAFDDKEQSLLKSMSNDAFNHFKPILLAHKNIQAVIAEKDKELATLKSGKVMLPDSYYENENGYLLDPAWNKAASNLNEASIVQDHWQQQMVNVRKGLPWKELTRNAQGQLTYGAEHATDADTGPEAEALIMRTLQGAGNQYAQIQQQVYGIQNGFKSKYGAAMGALKEGLSKHFGYYDDPKNSHNETKEGVKQMIPAEFRSHPLAEGFARAVATMLAFQNENKNLKSGVITKQQEAARTAEVIKKAGPTDSNSGASGSGGGLNKAPSFEDFDKVLRGED